jgi:site-specific DNA-methyltransferase (adenine-specific)
MTYDIRHGDALTLLGAMDSESIQCAITSPPYWGLRDYGVIGQLGCESTSDAYVNNLVGVFRGLRRVLRDDGRLWIVIGDMYAANRAYQVGSTKGGAKHSQAQGFAGSAMKVPDGCKPKDLIGVPWMFAFALRQDGWYLRSDIVWHKPNAMPRSVKDRPTDDYEHVFLLSKSEHYFYDNEAIKEPVANGTGEMRNRRSVWSIPSLLPDNHGEAQPCRCDSRRVSGQ